jgi:DNA replication protein DnaC
MTTVTTNKMTARPASSPSADLQSRFRKLGLWGILAHWDELEKAPWLEALLKYEEEERAKRSLERRLQIAKIGNFKPLADFDWSWPEKIEREQIEDLFRFEFLTEAANVIFVGGNGIGKTMLAQNLAHQAILRGYTARFINASALLNELAAQETGRALERLLRRYYEPQLLAIDEVGYLGSTNKHADLLFEVISRRYQHKSTIVTTNKSFSEWNQVFPNASCIVALIDRLLHRAELVEIQGESYRVKEAMERQAEKAKSRKKGRSKS